MSRLQSQCAANIISRAAFLKRSHVVGISVDKQEVICGCCYRCCFYRLKHSGNCSVVQCLCSIFFFISSRNGLLKRHISFIFYFFLFVLFIQDRYMVFSFVYSGFFACVSQSAVFFPSLCRFLYSLVQSCAVMFRNSLKMLLGGKSNRKNRNSGRLS